MSAGRGREGGDNAYRLPPSVAARLRADGWRTESRRPWTHVRPAATMSRVQGWKLHVSATVHSADRVLAACAPVLVEAGCEFKYAATGDILRNLNDVRAPRGSSGKFLTAYPVDDEQFRTLAERLDEATEGLAGPRILSDARLRSGSLVHYRYGAFIGLRKLDHDGSYRYLILDPAGNPVDDRRQAFHSPPPWAVPPVPSPAAPPRPTEAVLHSRYRITGAIRHANKGGVYLADDRETGSVVVVKESRPHVATDDHGRDVRDVLRHEAAVLRRLGHLGSVPRLVDLFTDQEHVFLVETHVPGVPLARWVTDRLHRGDGLPLDQWWRMADRLTRLLRAVHGCHVVIRDLSPNNILVDEDGAMTLVDLEMAHFDHGGPPIHEHGGTPGFSAPEQFRAAAPDPSADLYSLGAVLFYLATCTTPDLLRDSPGGRGHDELVAARLGAPHRAVAPPEPVTRLLLALLREDPARRPGLDEVTATIAAHRPTPVPGPVDLWRPPTPEQAYGRLRTLPAAHLDALLDGAVAHLAATVDTAAERLWRSTAFGDDTEPCAVQHGAGGVLAVLSRLHRHRPSPVARRLVGEVADWIIDHLRTQEHRLPGLCFGAAGTALALHDAGTLLDRPGTTQLARALLADLPRRWPNPDVTHGAAGLGTALLLLWRDTGDSRLAQAVTDVADGLVDSVDPDRDLVGWTVPRDFDSALAGYRSYGFGHGTAGIGTFLLAAGQHLGRPDLTELAGRCGQTLVTLAEHRDDTAVWSEAAGKPGLLYHWCNGSSGVGTLFARLYPATGDPGYLRLADRAARAVLRQRWRSGTAYCHGLAGDGDFLLDLAEASGDPLHRAWAEEIACTLYDRRTYRDGHAVLPNETGAQVTAEFGAGLAGHLAFLLRLRYGGPRIFHPPVAATARVPS
ncbi:class IV lanthionine synthetase LanL [Micromonospora rosaria]|nr:class IV lanthionine synthetase LanL [Micromonospora rosaria]